MADAPTLPLDPERWYTPAELKEMGLVPAEILAVERWRTRSTNAQYGPPWCSWGRRIIYSGREILKYIGALEAA